jgi:DNA invertase Pin-like site-specific DNA recombinase
MRRPDSTEGWQWYTEKILPRHWERLAVEYVRQSTLQQVLEHQESTRLQYGLVRRAVAWGWPEARVLVIDADLGRSGTRAEGCHGFQRLVAEVGLDHVGLILGMARSSKDWHQLLEICVLFGTRIADLDGIYDSSQSNDRLLLGLKNPSLYNTSFTYGLSTTPSAAPASRDSE